MSDLATIVRDAVTALVPLLGVAGDAGVKELGKSAAASAVSAFKGMFGIGSTKKMVEDLARQPTDANMQEALQDQLRKLLEVDPALVKDLQNWLTQTRETAANTGILQEANFEGDDNEVNQQSEASKGPHAQKANFKGHGNRVNQTIGSGNSIS